MKASICRDDSLELILADHSDHADYESVLNHLNECPRCQQRLDEMSARPSWWQDARRHLTDMDKTLVPELPDVSHLVTAQFEDTAVVAQAEVVSFLDPPSHPEMMGRIGKYEIEGEIGRGGMGIVLKGFDSELNRPVAIKLLAPHLASSGIARQRFIREARAAAAVVHENVVAIHGIETNGSLPSIVMPYISGLSLQQHIDESGPLDTVDVVRIGTQIASGLAAAHEQGLVHRDIKPGNVMLENSINRVQITDFGLARAAHDANITRSGTIAGTPSFMAPEQALSEAVDHRSDLFSLGSVLYFAATGVLPFRASTPIGVMQQVCSAEPTPLRAVHPEVPRTLETIVEKLQAKSADERFQSATELQKYLNEYLGHLQQPTSRKAPLLLQTPASRRRRRKQTRRWAAISAIIALISITVAFSLVPTLVNVIAGRSPATVAQTPASTSSVPVTPLSQLDEDISELQRDVAIIEQESDFAGPLVAPMPADQSIDQLTGDLNSVEASHLPPGQSSVSGRNDWFDHEIHSIRIQLDLLEFQSLSMPSPIERNDQ